MKNLTLVDSGTISISAESSNGTAHKELEICVLDAPSAPLQLCSTNTTLNATTLSWKAPRDTNGSQIMGYIIQRRTLDHPRWRTVGKTNETTLTFEAGDLFSNEEYEFRVIAVNSIGESPASNQIEVATLSENEETFEIPLVEEVTLEAPAAPLIKIDGVRVALTWNAVAGALFYKIERCKEGGDWIEVAVVAKTMYVDASIMDDSEYSYRITAKSLDSTSLPSSSSIPTSLKEKKMTEQDRKGTDEKKNLKDEISESCKTLVKENPEDNKEEKVEEQGREEAAPKIKNKKHASPVDAILDTKQRLKKRKPVEVERRASIQQESIDVKQQKQPGFEEMRDNETKDAVTKIELEEVGTGKAVKIQNESDATP
ncbi:unnamed protein product, partial [Strongylus vulgaris]